MTKKQNNMKALEPVASPPTVKKKRSLSEAQERLLSVLKDPETLGLRPVALAKLAGIAPATYWAAFNDEDFLGAIENEVPRLLAANQLQTINNVLQKAQDPAQKSHHWAQTALKMMGKLDSDAKVDRIVILQFNNIQRPTFEPEKIIEGEKITE